MAGVAATHVEAQRVGEHGGVPVRRDGADAEELAPPELDAAERRRRGRPALDERDRRNQSQRLLDRTGQSVGLAAYDNTGATYDCFQTLFQRDSYDGAGAELTSTVHVRFPIQGGGSTGNNAAWFAGLAGLIPPQMVYGDGDNVRMTPLARAYDVTAHELTHAVTSATAKLAYQNESGALNEGLSDILAAVCEAYGVKCEIHMSGFANLQILGSTSEDVCEYYERGLLAPGVEYETPPPYLAALGDPLDEQGFVHLPQEPGMGYQIVWDYIEENRIRG